jgi:hypothetical protein
MKFGALLLQCVMLLLASEAGYLIGEHSVFANLSRAPRKESGWRNSDLSGTQSLGFHVATNDSAGAGLSFTFTGKELFEKLKASPGDIEMTRDLQRRRSAGEFILRNELPLMRRSQEWNFAAIAAKALTNNAARYNELISQLGINPDLSRDLQIHLSRIHRASLEAQSAIIQLLDARLRYDQRMRVVLGAEKYSRYREIEKLRPAEEDVQNIQTFLVHSNQSRFEGSRELALARLIAEADAVEDSSGHGPYSPLPSPAVGREQVIAMKEHELARLTAGSRMLINRIGEMGLDSEQRACISAYYDRKLASKHSEILALNERVTREPPPIRKMSVRRDVGGGSSAIP